MKTQEEMDRQGFYVPDPAKMTIEDNALLFQSSLLDESRHRICDDCGEKLSNHSVGDKRLCCKCYIEEGNPPADWHRGCMEVYNRINNG
ncbi:MAG TPA: hypothetical protein ENH82_16720 [bacterium]|nr:hypothetical protein [bacterium]